MKPICVNCKLFFRPAKCGVYFTEGAPRGAHWFAYKIWVGDRWGCPGCGASIIVGCGLRPVAEHYQDGFEEQRKRLGADELQINDC